MESNNVMSMCELRTEWFNAEYSVSRFEMECFAVVMYLLQLKMKTCFDYISFAKDGSVMLQVSDDDFARYLRRRETVKDLSRALTNLSVKTVRFRSDADLGETQFLNGCRYDHATGMFSVCISNYILPYMAGRKGCALLLANGLYEKWKEKMDVQELRGLAFLRQYGSQMECRNYREAA